MPLREQYVYGQIFMTEAPPDSLPSGLSMRYAGNLESFKVEEQVALSGALISAHSTAVVDFLGQALQGLRLGVSVNVLNEFILDDLDTVFAGFVLETEVAFELLEHCCGRFLPSEPYWIF